MAAKAKTKAPPQVTPQITGHAALRQGAGRLSAQDTLMNLVTGMGGDKDKLAGTVFGYNMLAQQQLDAAYRGDWISRKIVDIPAYDAFREWRSWQADKKDITTIEELEKTLRVQRKSMLALQRGRLYGGGALILGVDQGTSDQEINFDGLKKDCLKFVHVVSRYDLQPGPIVWDVMSPYFGEPSYYTRSGDGAAQPMRLHPSRVVRFTGHESADIRTAQGWGDSVLQVCADAVIACGTVASSVAQLVAEAKIDVIKIPELSENLSDPVYEGKLKNRFATANMIKSVFAMLIIDKEEEWQRIEQNFSGLDDVLKMYLLIASGAADIPATRMLGQSPAGLSATGDSDVRNYYDRIATEQSVIVQPAMERLDKILVVSSLGTYPDGMFYDWNALWQMDPKDAAEIAVKKASVMKSDVDAALMDPMVLQKARENQLIEDGTYPGLEQIIEDHGTDIDERESDPALNDPMAGIDPNDPIAVAAATKAQAKGLKVVQGGKKFGQDAINDMARRIADNNPNHDPDTGEFTTAENAGHGSPITINGKVKKSTDITIMKAGKTVGTVKSTQGNIQTSVHQGAKYASGRGEVERFRAKENSSKPASYHKSRKEAEAYLKQWFKEDSEVDDATTPRTLYVRRDLINQKEVSDWFKEQGIETTVTDMHVTIAYSKKEVDWLKAGDYWMGGNDDKGQLIVKAGGPRVMEQFNKAVVMAFANTDLQYRHMSIREGAGASWDHEDYTPHVTITYNSGAFNLQDIQPFNGKMVFGPEIFEEIKEDFDNNTDVVEDKE